jgi:hypothetical protein
MSFSHEYFAHAWENPSFRICVIYENRLGYVSKPSLHFVELTLDVSDFCTTAQKRGLTYTFVKTRPSLFGASCRLATATMKEEDISSANDVPEFQRYNPGSKVDSNIVCNYVLDTRCDRTCLAWNNELLQSKLYPYAKLCFPSFDPVYGNCSIQRTMYENSTPLNRDDS